MFDDKPQTEVDEDLLRGSDFAESPYMVEGELERYGHIFDIAFGRKPASIFIRSIAIVISLFLVALVLFIVSLLLFAVL